MVRLADGVEQRSQAIVRLLVPLVQPELILLFGSRASGKARPDSDYDVMLVLRDGADTDAQRNAAHDALRQAGISADVLVRTAAHYLRRQHDPGCLEWLLAREGRVLYSSGAVEHRSPVAASRVQERPTQGQREWVERADADYANLTLALAALDADELLVDSICFHAHACAEKLLKALIAGLGRFPPRTHDLEELVRIAPEPVRSDDAIVSGCVVLQKVYPKSRYAEQERPTVSEARETARAAGQVRSRLRPLVT
jgi:HEPN domain-containing protein/predicted nucleotidyltransferase